MYCTKCGKQANPGDVYCAGCGARLAGNPKKPSGKKKFPVLLVVILAAAIFLAIGIFAQKEAAAPAPHSDPVLVDTADYTVTYKGCTLDDADYLIAEFLVENRSGKAVVFAANVTELYGYGVGMSAYQEVAPGTSATAQMYLDTIPLAAAGLESLEELPITFYIEDPQTLETLYGFQDATLPVSVTLDADVMKVNFPLYSCDDYDLSVNGAWVDREQGVCQLSLLLENRTDTLVGVEGWDDAYMGDAAVTFWSYGSAAPNTKALISATFADIPFQEYMGAVLDFSLTIFDDHFNPLATGIIKLELDRDGSILRCDPFLEALPQEEMIPEETQSQPAPTQTPNDPGSTYYADGTLQQETRYEDGQPVEIKTYYPDGILASCTQFEYNSGSLVGRTVEEYDDHGNPLSVTAIAITRSGEEVLDWYFYYENTYDDQGRPVSLCCYNRVGNPISEEYFSYYDDGSYHHDFSEYRGAIYEYDFEDNPEGTTSLWYHSVTGYDAAGEVYLFFCDVEDGFYLEEPQVYNRD